MIDTCDPLVATWSDDGTAFVVKDTEKFASDIIGQFFKVRSRAPSFNSLHGLYSCRVQYAHT
jgi:HSF-type DNA-binding